MSEPNSGSDVVSMRLKAEKKGTLLFSNLFYLIIILLLIIFDSFHF